VDIKSLDLRAPGMTQMRLSGRLGTTSTGAQFVGSTKVEANDPRALVAWLTERNDEPAASTGPLRLGGDVTLGGDAITIEGLKVEFDRMTVAGHLAYGWASDDRQARLDLALTAPEIDFDRVHAVAKAVLGDSTFDWPREGALSLKIARAFVAGVEAKQTDVNMRVDANGFEIERFAVADFGGAALTAKGRIDGKAQSPRGAVTLDLDVRALDGGMALMEKIAPQTAEQLRRASGRLTPATLRASLSVDPAAAGSANAKLKIGGRAGTFRVALQGDAATASDAFKLENLATLGAAKVNLNGRPDADDGAALIEVIGLDRLVSGDNRRARLAVAAKGPLDGDLLVDGQLAAGALNIATKGTIRVPVRASPSADLNLRVTNANIRLPRPAAAGRAGESLPASVTAWLALSEGMLRFSEVAGTVAGASVGGRLTLGVQQPITVEGDIERGAGELPAASALPIGIPGQGAGGGAATGASASANASGPWPAEPFEQGLTALSGQIAVKSARVALTPKLAARDVRVVVRFGESELALEGIDGSIAGGR